MEEVKPGEMVNCKLQIVNCKLQNAEKIKVNVYDPDKILSIVHSPQSIELPAGSFTTIDFSCTTTTTSKLGIYTVTYELLDNQDNIIQNEIPCLWFAVSHHFPEENPQITQIGTETVTSPMVSALFQSFPNPAKDVSYIPFNLSNDAFVSLEIYNILGQKIRTIDVGQRKKGFYTTKDKAIFWDLKDNAGEKVAKGLYFYKINAGDFSAIKAMVVGNE